MALLLVYENAVTKWTMCASTPLRCRVSMMGDKQGSDNRVGRGSSGNTWEILIKICRDTVYIQQWDIWE